MKIYAIVVLAMKYYVGVENMKVLEVLAAIANKQMNISELAKQYGVSDRTIQKKIKALGYVWSPKERRYGYEGEGNEQEYVDLEFASLFEGNAKLVVNNKPVKKVVNKLPQLEGLDNIDLLFNSVKSSNEKVYRGYYIDQDILNVIEQVESGNRSELINECLRKVFKEKGLL